MKTIMKFTAIISFLLVTSTTIAKDPEFSVEANGESKSLVLTLDTQWSTTKLRILDKENNVIYNETVSKSLYAKKFDLSKLQKGNYSLEVDNSLRTIYYTIEVGSEDLEIIKRKERSKPVFRKTENKVFLNLLNLDAEDVEVKVIDSQNRVVYTEVVEGESIVEKAFNFEKAHDDRYTVLVKDDMLTYSESILVK
ncbi:DUF3244 domain-containing protein [Eudoraea chungangensis]|uniref:DUF3244 domain-containing protein n=1 Tax=Eudoraea chungangensis TaxID=1481905 RepID=UPI0023EACA00|nr:hypothetical protein [Eudoraea chungangensis]